MNKKPKKDNIILRHTIFALLAMFATLFVLFTLLRVITRHNKEIAVPSFINMSLQQASEVAKKNNMRIEIVDSVYITRMAPGAVFKQNPHEGSMVKKNRRILLTVNATQPKMVKMPSLVGFSLRQAISELTANRLNIGKLIYVEDLATNNVLEQLYGGRNIEAGNEIPSESSIDLRLGLNQEDSVTFVPQMRGIKYSNAKVALAEKSLNFAKAVFDSSVRSYSDSMNAQVYKQVPAWSDTTGVAMGTSVTLYFTIDKSILEKTDEK